MITIISGTNRQDAVTHTIAEIYSDILNKMSQQNRILDLKNLPPDFIFSALYEKSGKHDEFNRIQEMIFISHKFVFIIPEYNGSFPGVLKAFLDGLDYPSSFKGKVAALVGLSSGTQGGAIAMSHLTDILNYLGMFVLPLKARFSQIDKSVDLRNKLLTNNFYHDIIMTQAKQLANFNCLTFDE
jgi:chromate reductase, NAD(P)H dehydrogenase (quinone)